MIDNPSTQERVFAIVAQQTQVDCADLRPDLPIKDLGADSLDLVGAFAEIEGAFGITIPEEEWARIQTLGDMVALVERQRQSAAEAPAEEPLPQIQSGGFRRWLLRATMGVLTRTIYRVKVLGRENIPATGGALLVPNHVSFVDALFLLTGLGRPARFLVYSTYYEKPLFKPFLEAVGAIPISSSGGPLAVFRSLRRAGKYLDRGELVCIFPEGQLTRTGLMTPFQRGMERIVKGRDVPIIPVYLDRLWGSVFSRSGGRFFFKWPARIPYPVTVCFGKPLPPTTPVPQVRHTVHNLSEQAWSERKRDFRPLHRAFIAAARKGRSQLAMVDGLTPPLSRLRTLAGAIALARALRPHWQGQEHVGILLPTSVGGAITNLAAALAGKVAVNLNFTAGREGMTSAARQAQLQTIVTSRKFLEKARLELPEGVRVLYAEDLKESIGLGAKLWAMCLARFAPARWVESACGHSKAASVDDLATIIFSSGSTGEPKGVMLSHLNIAANVEAVAQVFRVEANDRLLAILPLFHSFGYLSMWVGVTQGIGLVFHPNPLDAGVIGDLTERYRATILLATPTFLGIYRRRCSPAQFGSLRIVLGGAEKFQEQAVQAFEDHFGITPLEGYGLTECSPVVAASTLDFRAAGLYQPGSRRGSVGQPLPGTAVCFLDPQAYEQDPRVYQIVPPGTPGILAVKGLNVMRGYLGREDLTAKAMWDGWYVTGDVAVLDNDGFLRITGRLSRFAKIGGEMVPLDRVEQALHQAAGTKDDIVFAVTSLPDKSKGERLAVAHTLDENRIPEVLEKLASSGLPNLFLPRRECFVRVGELPKLPTGKMDQRAVKRVVEAALGG